MLYLVSTPIGNLGDISQRALETLQMADWVISEDTRHTGHLLNKFGIKKPQISFNEHNEAKTLPRVLSLLQEGLNIALVSDAGTPVISDPGYILVRAAIQHQIPLTAIPGPTALIMALTLSGLPAHSFTFRGFPPHKAGPRKTFFKVDAESPHTLIFYESPYRLEAFFQDALEVFGDRPAALANDLTKFYESVERGLLSEILAAIEGKPHKGEYCVVIGGK